MRNYTDVTVLLDKSGSMRSVRIGVIEGFNAFLVEQKSIPGDGCWTLAQFSYDYRVNYAQIDQSVVPLLTEETYRVGGGTALYDAICRTIDDTGRRLAALPEHLRPDKVQIIIQTDGEENSSRSFCLADVVARIKHQTDVYKWNIEFLGADMDAMAVGTSLGFAAANTTGYKNTYTDTTTVFRSISKKTRDFKLDGNDSAAVLLGNAAPDNK